MRKFKTPDGKVTLTLKKVTRKEKIEWVKLWYLWSDIKLKMNRVLSNYIDLIQK